MKYCLQDLHAYRIPHLTALCPSHKKFCHKTLKCDANAQAKADAQVRVTTIVASRKSGSHPSVQLTVKILKIGTPEIITIIVLQCEQLDLTVQHGVQKMQTE